MRNGKTTTNDRQEASPMVNRLLSVFVVTVVFLSGVTALGQAPVGAGEPNKAAQGALSTEQIVPGITRIYTSSVPNKTSVNMYLVTGTNQALLIDTGYPDDITPEYVRTLTPLPLIVVNTHAHPDHSGCNEKFGKVYVHPADVNAAKRYSGKCELLPVQDKHVFDLGGRKLEVILTVGHTPGSICLLDAQDKLLFTGDSSNGEVWMHISSVPLETYLKSIKHVMERKNEYNKLLLGHGAPVPDTFLLDVVACAQEILDGKGQASGTGGGRGLNSGASHRVGRVLIRYTPDNLREKKG
jgi:hydroxyacylglutathione hydrolase